ncbi:MAG: T9SS type A sorting domain-containing protein [Bacteroidales bacterium]
MQKQIYFFVLFLFYISGFAQYPPAVGQPGTTAIFKDSSVFIDWANTCKITRGYVNISDTTTEDPAYPGTNKASFGDSSAAIGIADNNTVSLGDAGTAVLEFNHPLSNGPGFDFAVFENSFDDIFLELAFVEASSDGTHFVRFPSVSLTQTSSQIQGFGVLDATKIHNLAGKYKVFYGTPFDLSDLQDSSGINLNHITHIRIVDVIGSISEPFISYDSKGHSINDPFPTPFWTAGFDLDAVGVIHNTQNTGYCSENIFDKSISIYPNPVNECLTINPGSSSNYKAQIIDVFGRIYKEFDFINTVKIDVTNLSIGLYYLLLKDKNDKTTILKFFKNR